MVSWRKERGLGKEGKGGKDGEVGTQGLFVRDQFLEKSGKKERENSIKGGKEEKEVEIGERHTQQRRLVFSPPIEYYTVNRGWYEMYKFRGWPQLGLDVQVRCECDW